MHFEAHEIPKITKQWICRLNLPMGVEFDEIEQAYIHDDGQCYKSLTDIPIEKFNAVHTIINKELSEFTYKRHVFCVDGEGDNKSVHVYREFADQNGKLVYYKTA